MDYLQELQPARKRNFQPFQYLKGFYPLSSRGFIQLFSLLSHLPPLLARQALTEEVVLDKGGAGSYFQRE
jgi:hypothetical protein